MPFVVACSVTVLVGLSLLSLSGSRLALQPKLNSGEFSTGYRLLGGKGSSEVDSAIVVEALSAINSLNHPYQHLINEIKTIGNAESSFEWKKIDRCINSAADRLAKLCIHLDVDCTIFDSPPPFIFQALIADNDGLRGFAL